jgi:hypothetical protein
MPLVFTLQNRRVTMRQKKTPVHFLCCNAAMQSLSTLACHMESVEFQATLMLPPSSDDTAIRKPQMKELIVELSEELGGSHVNLDKVVDLWDSVKECYFGSMDPTDGDQPRAIDLCLGAAEDAISMLLNFMER